MGGVMSQKVESRNASLGYIREEDARTEVNGDNHNT